MTTEITALINTWIRAELRGQVAYHVPDPGELIKLDAMENPYPLPAALRNKLLAELRDVEINRYPDAGAAKLKDALRTAFNVDAQFAMLLGNGSDELIQLILLALVGDDRSVLLPTPTFSMYSVSARLLGFEIVSVPLREDDFQLDLPAMLRAIEQHQPALILLANPNNPTACQYPLEQIAEIVSAAPGLVLIDEAYLPFSKQSVHDQLGDWPNALVLRTISKMGLAGLRLGYCFGAPELINSLEPARLPYNINSLTQAVACGVLAEFSSLAEQVDTICATRERVCRRLDALEGVQYWPSATNFFLIRTRHRGDDLAKAFEAEGVLVKSQEHADPVLSHCIRVSIGTDDEMERFLTVLAANV